MKPAGQNVYLRKVSGKCKYCYMIVISSRFTREEQNDMINENDNNRGKNMYHLYLSLRYVHMPFCCFCHEAAHFTQF